MKRTIAYNESPREVNHSDIFWTKQMISNKLLQRDTQHFLKQPFSFWVRRGQIDMSDYEKSVKLICTFNTVFFSSLLSEFSFKFFWLLTSLPNYFQVEDFWILYDHTMRPSEVSYPCDYHLFRKGVKPMWEVWVKSGLFF